MSSQDTDERKLINHTQTVTEECKTLMQHNVTSSEVIIKLKMFAVGKMPSPVFLLSPDKMSAVHVAPGNS